MVRCKRYSYHLQFVFNLNTTFWDKNRLFDKKKYNFMKNINSDLFFNIMDVCRKLFLHLQFTQFKFYYLE